MRTDFYLHSVEHSAAEDYIIIVGGKSLRSSIPVTEDNITLNETINIYPNPVSEELIIQRTSGDRKSTEVINVSKLANGVYFVRLKSGDIISTKKITVAH